MRKPSAPSPASSPTPTPAPARHSGGLVYSTDAGRMCPTCRKATAACICKQQAAAKAVPKGDSPVRVSREKRNGKDVTVLRGLPLAAPALADWAKRLRTACSAGGTAKDGVVEVQGDHVERVLALLAQEGFRAKRAGG